MESASIAFWRFFWTSRGQTATGARVKPVRPSDGKTKTKHTSTAKLKTRLNYRPDGTRRTPQRETEYDEHEPLYSLTVLCHRQWTGLTYRAVKPQAYAFCCIPCEEPFSEHTTGNHRILRLMFMLGAQWLCSCWEGWIRKWLVRCKSRAVGWWQKQCSCNRYVGCPSFKLHLSVSYLTTVAKCMSSTKMFNTPHPHPRFFWKHLNV